MSSLFSNSLKMVQKTYFIDLDILNQEFSGGRPFSTCIHLGFVSVREEYAVVLLSRNSSHLAE